MAQLRTTGNVAPDLLTEALEYQLVVQRTDSRDSDDELDLYPDVKFSLRITDDRYPPENDDSPDAAGYIEGLQTRLLAPIRNASRCGQALLRRSLWPGDNGK